jgi:hypothetical protein
MVFMYSIAEVAKMLNKSKTAIYDKINSNKHIFNNHLSFKKGSKHLSKEGYKILYSMFNEVDFPVDIKEDKNQPSLNINISTIEMYEKQTELLENQLKILENQLEYLKKDKNEQIEELKKDKEFLQNQLIIKNKLIEQSNVLLLQEKNKDKYSIWKKIFKISKKDNNI